MDHSKTGNTKIIQVWVEKSRNRTIEKMPGIKLIYLVNFVNREHLRLSGHSHLPRISQVHEARKGRKIIFQILSGKTRITRT